MGKRGGGKPAPAKGNKNNDFEREEILQAVVLADSFTRKFYPITAEKPKVLLPLVNIPMIDYTLEFLGAGGVQEIFVICCAHAEQVKEYLAKSPWSQKGPELTLRVIISDQAFSAGDALRHLDTLDVIKDDFVLISGDVISNIKLDTVLAAHKARVAQDKRNIMTVVMKQASQNHRTRTLDDDTVVCLNRETNQMLMFSNEVSTKDVELDVSLFEDNEKIQIRYDLMDSNIDICSPEVLMLFTDNFDYQDIRADFLCGVLGSEILGNKIFTHVISGGYAARVRDMRTYDSVSRDVIHRWTFPMVPEVNLFAPTTYKFNRHNIYREDNVQLVRTAKLLEDTVVGAGCTLGANSVVKSTVLGRNCSIGANVSISDSYIFGDCIIEDGVEVERAIICNGAHLKKGAKIEAGAVISFGVVIGEGFTVKSHTYLTMKTIGDDGVESDDEDEEVQWNEEEVGVGGAGMVYVGQCDDSEDDEDEPNNTTLHRVNSMAPDLAALSLTLHSDEDTDSEDGFETEDDALGEIIEGEDETKESAPDANIEHFYSEMRETLQRGINDNLEVDAVVLELASLKLSHDAFLSDYSAAALLTLLTACGVPDPSAITEAFKPTKKVVTEITAKMSHWGLMLLKYGKQVQDQIFIIHGIEIVCSKNNFALKSLFQILLKEIYDQEIVSEEAIEEWEAGRVEMSEGPEKEASMELIASAKTFLTWLKEADDESDEGDEGDEGETDSEDDE